uniref:Endonuclease/exonuclease/phosphatase domain-containing protein n=1 Tax=Sus scrofa TaxID=9823 RepID=A0A8D1SJI9_PIG
MLTTLKGQIDNTTIIVGDFNTPLTAMDRSSRQKIHKETHALNDALHQRDSIDIYRTFHPKAAEYTFFSSAHGTFSKMDHMLYDWAKNPTLVALRKLKSYQASFPTTMLYGWTSTTKINLQNTQTRGDETTSYSTTNASLKKSKSNNNKKTKDKNKNKNKQKKRSSRRGAVVNKSD